MVTHQTLRNFKSISEQTYDFSQFGLPIGSNATMLPTIGLRGATDRDKGTGGITIPRYVESIPQRLTVFQKTFDR